MEKRLNELDEAITNTPSYLSKQRSQVNFRIQEKSKQSEQSSKGQLKLHYLRQLKQNNKTSRFNEDLGSQYSHVLSLGNAGKSKNTISAGKSEQLKDDKLSSITRSSRPKSSGYRKLTSDALSKFSAGIRSQTSKKNLHEDVRSG